MQRFINYVPRIVYGLTVIVGYIGTCATTAFVFLVGLREIRRSIIPVLLQILVIVIYSSICYGLFTVAIRTFAELVPCCLEDAILRWLVRTTHSSFLVLHPRIKPTWAAEILLSLPREDTIRLLETIDKRKAWDILCVIQHESDGEFLSLLKSVGSQKAEDFLMFETISKRHEIKSRLSAIRSTDDEQQVQ